VALTKLRAQHSSHVLLAVTTHPSPSPQRSTHNGDDGMLPLSLTADNRCMPHRHLLHLQIRTRTRCAFTFVFCMWVCFFFQPLAVWHSSPPVRDCLTRPSPRPVVARLCAAPSRPPQLRPHPSSPPSFHPHTVHHSQFPAGAITLWLGLVCKHERKHKRS
jgi:hypothetical protein